VVSVCLIIGALCPSQSRVFEIPGPTTAGSGVSSVAGLGDIDGDGFPDLAVGFHGDDTKVGKDSGSVSVYSGSDGRVIHRLLGPKTGSGFGWAVSGVGDVDKDGIPDIGVGAPSDSSKVGFGGSVSIYSGKSGSRLRYWVCSTRHGRMGVSLAGVGDVNGDSHGDVLIGFLGGCTLPAPKNTTGEVHLLSGKDSKLLWFARGKSNYGGFGCETCAIGDINGDRIVDVAVGQTGGNGILLYSGSNGSLLATYNNDPSKNGYAFPVLANVGDVDKDGMPDLGVSLRKDARGGLNSGSCYVISNKTGKILHWKTGAVEDRIESVVGIGDADDDGYDDFALGATQVFPNAGYVRAFSGKTGKELFTVRGRAAPERLGFRMALIGDVVGNGSKKRLEIVVASPRAFPGRSGNWRGRITVISTEKLPLAASPHRLSLKSAGSQRIDVDFGASRAGKNYWLLGSVTGRRPGTRIGPFRIPLVVDAYTLFLIAHPSSSYFVRFRGRLDSSGKASARFSVPSGLPPLSPFTLFHACVAFDNQGAIVGSSNSVSLRLE
jgi:FG-GAP repeat